MNTRAPATDHALSQSKPLTVEQEMAKFSGYTTNNGETVDPKSPATRRGSTESNLSPEEEAAGARVINDTPRARAADAPAKATKVELSDEEAHTALSAARTSLKLQDGEELTEEEEAAALEQALAAKKAGSKSEKPLTADDKTRKHAQVARRKAEARAARLESQLATVMSRLETFEKGVRAPLDSAAKPDNGEAEPDASKFPLGELDTGYIRALARWEARQEAAERSKKQEELQLSVKQQAAAAEQQEKVSAFEDAGTEVYDDFTEVVLDTAKLPSSDPAYWPCSATIGALLLDSKFGPQIAYALAGDPKEAKRVDGLTDAEKQRWFFRQEAKLEAEAPTGADGEQDDAELGEPKTRTPNAQPRIVSKAPAPPRRSAGGSGNRGGTSPATQDFAAFEALANGGKR